MDTTSLEAIQGIAQIIQEGGFLALVVWLLIREQNMHTETRDAYRQDLRDIAMRRADTKNEI